jgi:hypothetical protein
MVWHDTLFAMKLTREQLRALRKPFRKHDQFRVVITYHDDEQFARVFTNQEQAEKYAARQERSPAVKSAKVSKLD